MRRRSRCLKPQKASGMAMVLVLAAVVLVSVLIVSFLARASLHSQMARGQVQVMKVESLAGSALDSILEDLRSEIVAGSSTGGTPDTPVYFPKPGAALPVPVGLGLERGQTGSLLKRSAHGLPFFSGPAFGGAAGRRRASGPSEESASDRRSQNGRYVSLARWNRPLLMPSAIPGSLFDATPAGIAAPDWICIGRDGSNPEIWSASLADSSARSFILGRYAYMIYHEGGLLDINAAGYPSGLSGEQLGRKNALSSADLTALAKGTGFTQEQVDSIIGWRHSASLKASGSLATGYKLQPASFFNLWMVMPRRFLGPASGAPVDWQTDRQFASRQMLLDWVLEGLPKGKRPDEQRSRMRAVLPSLATFTRDLNQPSVFRDIDRPRVLSGENSGFGKDDEINPNFLEVRIPADLRFTRNDGNAATAGEPLVKSRFPLSRLALVGKDTVAKRNQEDFLYRHFGVWRRSANEPWTYDHGGNGRILTLNEVAAQGREADCVELLKASILVGSLGKTSGYYRADTGPMRVPGLDAQPGLASGVQEKNVDLQVLQIFSNLVDQWDSDGYPTLVELGTGASGKAPPCVAGIENLPYLAGVRIVRVPNPEGSGAKVTDVFMCPVLWNPHGNAKQAAASGPRQFRFVAVSGSEKKSSRVNVAVLSGPAGKVISKDRVLVAEETAIHFQVTGTENYEEPKWVTAQNYPTGSRAEAGPGNVLGRFKDSSGAELYEPGPQPADAHGIGVYMGSFSIPEPGPPGEDLYEVTCRDGIWLCLQYLEGSRWKTYDVKLLFPDGGRAPASLALPQKDARFYVLDPRTGRFGFLFSQGEVGNGKTLWSSTRSLAALDCRAWEPLAPGWMVNRKPEAFFGTVYMNGPGADTHYADADGVVRRADGAWAQPAGAFSRTGLGLLTGNLESRPVVLNRAFESVLEMGCCFRGTPWKQLDFFTQESGDSALLDVFTLGDYQSAEPLLAGVLNPNTDSQEILEAVLRGSSKTAGSFLSADEARAGAKILLQRTQTPSGQIRQRPEWMGRPVARSGKGFEYPGFAADAGAAFPNKEEGYADQRIKARRESLVRALVPVSNTRTWNLMVDLVVQAGRFGPGAKGFADFTVTAERRLWLHVAIDRMTGQVLDRQIERVEE